MRKSLILLRAAKMAPAPAVCLAVLACGSVQGPTGAPGALPAPSEADSQALPTRPAAAPRLIKIAYAGQSGSTAPLWLAKEAGIFEKYGIQVELTYIAAAAANTQALLARDVEFSYGAGTQASFAANFEGADLVVLGALIPYLAFDWWGKPEIRGPQDLKGRKIGITRFGSATDYLATFVLKRWGLERDVDVSVVQTMGMPEMLAALEAGGVDVGILSAPTTLYARKGGFRKLLDGTEAGISQLGSPVVASRSYMRQNPNVTMDIMKALVEGIFRFKTNATLSKRVMGQYLQTDDDEVLQETWEFYKDKFERSPVPRVDAAQAVLEELGATDPRARTANLADFLDTTYIERMEQSGFIRALYAQ